jgi:amino acid transporter
MQWVVMEMVPNAASAPRPLSELGRILIGDAGAKLVAAAALLCLYGYLSANALAAPRQIFAMAEKRDFPSPLARVHERFRTPHIAIALWAVLCAGLAIYGNFQWNATISGAARIVIYGCVCLSLIRLRRVRVAPWVAPAGVLWSVLGIAICCVLLSRLGTRDMAAFVVLAGLATVHWVALRLTAKN